MNDDENDGFDIVKVGFILFAVVIFLYVAKDWGSWIVPKNWTIVIQTVLIYSAGMLPYWVSKYKMPQFQANGCHGSFQHNDSPIRVEDYYLVRDKQDPRKIIKVKFYWLVYGLGASLLPVPTKGKDAICIVPECQVDTRGKNHYCSTQVFLTPLDKLPLPVFNFVTKYKDNYNLKKIFIGSKNISFESKNFDDADKDLKIEQLQSQVNMSSKMLAGDFSGYEKVKNLVDKLNPRASVWERIFARSPSADQNAPTV